jgi:regulator of cell morphogenesis and NO signaling
MRLDVRTLADLVTAHPGAARTLERHGLDYCCHGDRSLVDACRTAGLDPEVIAAELSTDELAGGPEPWAHLGVAALVDHVEAVHHRFLWEELPRVGELVGKVVGVHGERHPELAEVATVFAVLRAELEPHLAKEEQVLFPMIRQLADATTPPTFHCGRISTPISVMLREHDQAGELLAELRALTDGYRAPDDACASYRACYEGLAGIEADTHLHVHKENNVLFPAVVELERQLHDVQPELST